MRWYVLVLVMCCLPPRSDAQNCRGEEYHRERECEAVCRDGQCTIRAALLLPRNTTYLASMYAVQPVFDLALQDPKIKGLLPFNASFEVTTYDVEDCDPAYAIISAIDAYTYDCAHVYFGPACDFALGMCLFYPSLCVRCSKYTERTDWRLRRRRANDRDAVAVNLRLLAFVAADLEARVPRSPDGLTAK
ncbi:hypothetical protein EVAR_83926_1 [Eumeta japonica]|uniref:Secreted protein n=1 Tax=Eumeta variegata TaxID=151549 RepID=A0A4C1XQD3_EUMVA|nr:hypothetical protein EVAR_83926_1 [Eumeta japonica]